MNEYLRFASSSSDYSSSEYVIVGVPFDLTSSYRAGTAAAPDGIRKASYGFEPYMFDYGLSLSECRIHDMGDIECDDQDIAREHIRKTAKTLFSDEKFPIFIGGEHSITPHIISQSKDIYVLILDAHLDYRDTYEGNINSHATVSRRVSELEIQGMKIFGVRSISQSEMESDDKPDFISSYDIHEDGGELLKMAKELKGDVYLSIDMDVFDPSYAPGVGNPEPYGLAPIHCKRLLNLISHKLVGLDIVETNPRYDSGEITVNLAARLIYDVIGARSSIVG